MSSLRTKEEIEMPTVFDKQPKMDKEMPTNARLDFDSILNKPFLIGTATWNTTSTKFTELIRIAFPSAIMTNALAKVPFLHSTYYNLRMCVMLQVSGTPMHQGILVAATMPHTVPIITKPNQLLSAPHVFLNANESTAVCLETPMYVPTATYLTPGTDSSSNNSTIGTSPYGQDFCDLVIFVMNPLAVAAGAATSVSVSIHVKILEGDFYVPKAPLTWVTQGLSDIVSELATVPTTIMDDAASGLKKVTGDIIDYGRSMIRTLTGFHAPNIPTVSARMNVGFRNNLNNVDIPSNSEVLDPHAQFNRIYDDYYFRTAQDEMDIKYLCSKPMYVGTFNVSSTTPLGKNVFTYPITPMIETTAPTNSTIFYSPMRTIAECSRYWRGSMKLHIQVACTNFHYCKLLILKYYAPTLGLMTVPSVVPSVMDVHNLPTDTLEFTSGGQIHTITIPYISNRKQLPCAKDPMANALQHCVALGYLVQPLVYNSNVPTSIDFNVYISGGDDLEFSGYATDVYDIEPANSIPTYWTPQGTFVSPTVENPQRTLLFSENEYDDETSMSFRPNKSIRDYLRRMIPCNPISLDGPSSPGTFGAINVASLLTATTSTNVDSSFKLLSSMFLGLSGGLKVRLKIVGPIHAAVTYMPPEEYLNYTTNFSSSSATLSPPGGDTNFQNVMVEALSVTPTTGYSTGPQIELQDYTRSAGQISSNNNNAFTFDFIIPNMNGLNYVGGVGKWYDAARSCFNPENDLGVIYVRYVSSNAPGSYPTIYIQPFVGLCDESRLGYQVYNAPKSIPTVTSTLSSTSTARKAVYPTTSVFAFTKGLLPMNNLAGTPYKIT